MSNLTWNPETYPLLSREQGDKQKMLNELIVCQGDLWQFRDETLLVVGFSWNQTKPVAVCLVSKNATLVGRQIYSFDISHEFYRLLSRLF